MDVLSIVFFFASIAVAFVRKNNIGVLALAVGVIAVRIFGLTDQDLIGGISISLFTTLAGITLLFAIIMNTGALQLLAQKMIALAGDRLWLLPIFLFLAGFAIVAAGPGGVPALAIIPPLAVAIALQVGYDPLMLALIGICGMTSGRFSPITPEYAIIHNAVANAGLGDRVSLAMMANVFLTNVIIAVLLFIAFKGYKVKAHAIEREALPAFNRKQVVALLSILVMLFLIIFCKVHIGLAAIVVSAVLLTFRIADDTECIRAMPWGTIMMVLFVGAFLSVVEKAGGIALMNDGLASIMNEQTAVPLMGLSAGILSLVSSALGVVYPTMMPMCVDIAAQIGGQCHPVALMSAVGSAGALSGISPMSTGGALILAAIAGEMKGQHTRAIANKYFMQLLIIAVVSLLTLLICSALFYNPIAWFIAG